MDFSTECLEFVYGTLDGCLCFCMGKSNHKPIFDEFGSKRTLLVWCFRFGLVDCNSQVRNIGIKEILGEMLSKFLQLRIVIIT